MNVEGLLALGRLATVALHPSEDWLCAAVSRRSTCGARWVHDLWRLPLDGSEAVQLTFGEWNDRAPHFSNDGLLGFLSNRPVGKSPEPGEDERSQIWGFDPGGREARRLSDVALGVNDFRFAGARLLVWTRHWPDVPDADQRAHAAKRAKDGPSVLHYRRTPVRHWDHWLGPDRAQLLCIHPEGAQFDLTEGTVHEHERDVSWDVSADGRFVAMNAEEKAEDGVARGWLRRIAIRADGSLERIEDLGRAGNVSHYGAKLSPSGASLATQRHTRSGPDGDGRLPRVDLVVFGPDGSARSLATELDRWLSPECWLDERRLLCTFDDRGRTRLAEVDTETDQVRAWTDRGVVHGVVCGAGGSSSTTRVAMMHSTLTSAPRAATVDANGAQPLADPTGFAEKHAEALSKLVVEDLSVEAADGQQVHGLLLKPSTPGPHPCLLWIHGGPIHQWADGWHWRWNPAAFVEQGYAIALPNPRGSTGEGYEFTAGIWGNEWGAACYDDLMRFTDALEQRDDIDASRVAAMGGSFGGYMANWIGGHTGRFRALITHASLFDLRAFHGRTDASAYFGLHLASTPWTGEMDRYSPHRAVPDWKTPTLILHGEKDYRVPLGEALALFEGLQAHGVESELVVFPDENHWILQPNNAQAWHEAILTFLQKHVLD
jgi:dipeptidyl aminopeptidase/acylaminoacyl peptidase